MLLLTAVDSNGVIYLKWTGTIDSLKVSTDGKNYITIAATNSYIPKQTGIYYITSNGYNVVTVNVKALNNGWTINGTTLTVNFKETTNGIWYIYNSLGQKTGLNGSYRIGSNTIKVNVSRLAKGVYSFVTADLAIKFLR